jgi:hypothetical protein
MAPIYWLVARSVTASFVGPLTSAAKPIVQAATSADATAKLRDMGRAGSGTEAALFNSENRMEFLQRFPEDRASFNWKIRFR